MALQLIVLKSETLLIAEVEEVGAEIGEPDCKLTNVFEVVSDQELKQWPLYTDQRICMMSSDSILTLVKPSGRLEETYNSRVK
jgi:hypothetical protein